MNLTDAILRLTILYDKAKKDSNIHNPLAWALYQVWKEADKNE